MVSQRRAEAAGTRERLLKAATEEFAAKGFDGAKVERITRRARINKAMLYYHFDDKGALYRDIVGGLFRRLNDQIALLNDADAPEAQLRQFIRTIAGVLTESSHFPAIWLREVAEGGRHLDALVVGTLREIIGALGRILVAGQRQGLFAPAHPLIVQMNIVAPLLLFSASAPARERFKDLVPGGSAVVPRELMIAHVETATLAALRPPATTSARPSRRSSS